MNYDVALNAVLADTGVHHVRKAPHWQTLRRTSVPQVTQI